MTEERTWTREEYIDWEYVNYEDFMLPSGHMLIFGAFYEFCQKGRENVKYTMRNRAAHSLPSLYQIISNAKDEYDAAMKTCGDWQIWLRWKESRAIFEGERQGIYKGVGIRAALETMEARRTGEAMAEIIRRSDEGDYRAAKDLVTWGMPKKKTGKKVTQVPEDKEDNIFSIAANIAKVDKKA